MTSTPCQGAALDRIVTQWAARIAVFFVIIIEAILTIIGSILQELRTYSPEGRAAALVSAAPARITDSRRLDLDVCKARQALLPQLVLGRSPPRPMVRKAHG